MFYRLDTVGVGPDGWSSNSLYPRELADVNGDGKDDIVGFGKDNVYVALASNVPGGFAPAQVALNAFTIGAGGWSTTNEYPRELGDVNGDGKADIVGFGKDGVYVALGAADGTFGQPKFARADFGTAAGGWSSNDLYPRKVADVNGDGRADIVGFGQDHVFVALGTSDGGFGPGLTASDEFTNAAGWTSDDLTPRKVADVNGDGKADIVGFGKDGVYVAFGSTNGTFASAHVASNAFTVNVGWTSDDLTPRKVADVNGDGKADIVGFGKDGVYVALGSTDGTFGQPKFVRADFGVDANGWTSSNLFPRELGDVTGDGKADIVAFGQSGIYAVSGTELLPKESPMFYRLDTVGVGPDGWSSNSLYPRELADVNGDGKDDIVGFGKDNVYVALASNVPGGFAPAQVALNAFTIGAGGWSTTNEYPRELGDVNGDGKDDIVGFGKDGVYVALGKDNGTFGTPQLTIADFGTAAGDWSSNDLYPRKVGDVNGDGKVDIVGFGKNHVYVALGTSNGGFEPSLTASSEFTNAAGWASDDLTPREVADVNGDGKADIVGFGKDGVNVALGAADGTFASAHVALNAFTINAGWTSNDLYPRELGDVSGDGKADIVGFGKDGVYVALGAADGTFGQPKFVRADFGVNANGWTTKDMFPREIGDVTGDGKADIVAFGQSGIYAVSGTDLVKQSSFPEIFGPNLN